jgi:hypothetical protein
MFRIIVAGLALVCVARMLKLLLCMVRLLIGAVSDIGWLITRTGGSQFK